MTPKGWGPAGSDDAQAAGDHSAAFVPAWWCPGPHAQTMWGSLLRPMPPVPVTRVRWELPDGDFLDCDALSGPEGAPLLVVLHGLEGSSESVYVRGLLHEAHRLRWAGLAMNFRSCSGTLNRLRRSYHGGDTADLAWVIDRAVAEDADRPVLCAGFSLGGNVLLKYLGERGKAVPAQVRAAVAISAPCDLAASARALEHGFSRVYMKRFVRGLRQKMLAKLRHYPDLVDRRRLAAVRTMAEFDELVTAPVHGFPSAEAYWQACSASRFLGAIRCPTLLINAKDDPIVPVASLPVEIVSRNACLSGLFPEAGGHTGFLGGTSPHHPVAWAEARAIAFLGERRPLRHDRV